MAFLRVDFYSEALGSGTGMNVLLPEAAQGIGFDASAGTGALPVLYLLHGLSDDHTAWMRRTSLERYAASRRLAVVMPCGGRSFIPTRRTGAATGILSAKSCRAPCRAFSRSPAAARTPLRPGFPWAVTAR